MEKSTHSRNYELNKLILVILSSALLVSLFCLQATAQTYPAGFSQVKVATIYYPTSMCKAPDGRIFVTEKAGKVKIIKNGAVLPTPFLQVSVDQLNERGLSSIVLDPNFSSNHYVYIYYTTSGSPIHNRLSRFTANGDVALSSSEVVIKDFEPLVNSIHNGGGMKFGPDGKLYLATGNDNVNSYSQDMSNSKGKVLRMNPDGSVPSGNPFSSPYWAQYIWAYGLRNPWTIDIQPGTGKIFVNDVGEGAWEEVNNATAAGRNFGWPGSEGYTTNPNYTTPVYAYHHGTAGSDEGCAITGGAFFNPSSTNYPSSYTGKYFFIDYCNHWINYLDGTTKHNFATNLAGALNYIIVGPDGNLYYFSISQNSLYKIIYDNNDAPTITNQPDDVTVSAGQNAGFTVSASGADPKTYQWRKNGVNITGATSSTYNISNVNASHAGNYSCRVSNSFGTATSNDATLTVTAFNAKPDGNILSPANNSLYRGGDIISFSGDATDAEDGALPASAFNWYVEFRHDSHVHPGPFIPAGIKNGTFNISSSGEVSANVYYQLFLVVTDSEGAKDTSSIRIVPKTSTITIASQPGGLTILLDGQPHTTPYSMLAVSGIQRTLGANGPQTLGDSSYTFHHWSQGGAAAQTIVVGDNNMTYKAYYTGTYSGAGSTTCSGLGMISRDHWSNFYGASVSDIPVNTAPTGTMSLTKFEGPANFGDHYASRIRGYICPPVTGNYIFWIASDNGSELWLSTNNNPANKVRIASCPSWTMTAEWTKYASQQSAPVTLNANTLYYIEALHREGDQGDHLEVGWQLPNGTLQRPIPGSRLAPYTSSGGGATPLVNITSPANNTTYSNPANITFNANASVSGGTISKVEFYNGASLIGQDLTSPYSYTWMNVATGTYSITAKATSSTGQVGVSTAVTVIVQGCSTPVITPLGTTTMCSGSVTLKTAVLSGASYQWKKDGVNISGATGSQYTASAAGDYQVKVIQGACVGWSAPTTVRIGGGLRATITAGGPLQFCPGGNVKLYGNTCSGFTYQWIKNGADIPGATAATYTATTSGTYQLRVTQSGTSAWSSLVTVDVTCREGEEFDEGNPDPDLRTLEVVDSATSTSFQMKVFPNPNNGKFTIGFNMPAGNEQKIQMRIVNLLGQEIYFREITAKSETIQESVDLDPSLPTGIYTLQVMVGTKVENTTVVLSR